MPAHLLGEVGVNIVDRRLSPFVTWLFGLIRKHFVTGVEKKKAVWCGAPANRDEWYRHRDESADRSQCLPQDVLYSLAVGATQGQLCPVFEYDSVVPVEHRLKLTNTVDVHDGRAMDTEELAGIDSGLQRVHRLAQQVDFFPHV